MHLADPAVAAINNPTNATFKITDTKLYVPVVTLSTENDKKLLEQLRTGFKRTIKWNKYRSEMTNQTKTNNLNYLIDPTFNKVNRLFVLSLENEDDRTSYSKYYTSKVKTKSLNVVIINKLLVFLIQRRNIHFIEMSKNSDPSSGNVLGYNFFFLKGL